MGLMMGAGAVLGTVPAFTALYLSKTCAAIAAFALARGVLSERVARWLERYPRLARVLTDSGRQGGWRFVALMRLSPFPGFLLNYLLSLTGVGFGGYLFGTLLGIAPSILNLVLVGSAAREVGAGVAAGGVQGGWFALAAKTLCVGAMVAVSVLVTRRVRKEFAALDGEGEVPSA